jgi:aryl-alcohol dehydrogenase-like predicted oxidoreductase
MKRPLGPTGLEIHPVITGTFAIGGWWWGPSDDNESVQAIRSALDAEACAIDTAPVYGFGHAEEIVGRAISGRRNEVTLMTKVGLRWDGQGTPFFPATHKGQSLEVSCDLRPASIQAECHASLKRLGVDTIDLYQCHWPDPGVPIAESMGALLDLHSAGKIRAIGVSNFSVEQMVEAQAALGDIPLSSTQPHYSVLNRRIERDLVPYCQKEQIGIIGYRPMEQGLLTGKMTPERLFEEGDERISQRLFSVENRTAIQAAQTQVQGLADAHQLSLAQLSVAWVLHQPGVTGAICGARNAKQAAENAQAANATLCQEELDLIRNAFAGLPRRKKK